MKTTRLHTAKDVVETPRAKLTREWAAKEEERALKRRAEVADREAAWAAAVQRPLPPPMDAASREAAWADAVQHTLQQDLPRETDAAAFEAAHRELMGIQVLMSATNPAGWKLESLLKQLRGEIEAKCQRLATDTSVVAADVLKANTAIMGALFEAEGLQRQILATLDTLGPDQGPSGRPRLGLGANPGLTPRVWPNPIKVPVS